MHAVSAGIPVAVVLALMVGARWPAARAGLVGAATALVLALAVFGFGGPDVAYGRAEGVVGVLLEATWTTLTVVAIIGPAPVSYTHLTLPTKA